MDQKPIEFIKDDLQSVIFGVEVIRKEISELRVLTLDIIAKIEKHQQQIKEIDKQTKEKIENSKKGWFY